MANEHPRLARENKTIQIMISLYCHQRHGGNELCSDCAELLAYALERLRQCPFQQGKTTCAKCRVHCYQPVMREKIRAVMRYAGPRLMWRHPGLAVAHLIDGLKKEPGQPFPRK